MQYVAIYLIVGLVFLLLLDTYTRIIRKGFANTTYDAQITMANAGSYIGYRAMKIIVVFVLLVFWPGVLVNFVIGVIKRRRGK